MVKKPVSPKPAAKVAAAPKVDVNKHVIADLKAELKTLEQQKAELHADLQHAIDDCSEWVAKARQLEAEVEQLKKQVVQGSRDGSAQLARYQALLKPFIACAKGQAMTVPQDWDALKDL